MSGTFFLIPHWGFVTRENTQFNNCESTKASTSKNQSNHTEIIGDKKTIHGPSPTNRAECLIW